jgi:hypothetical protein
MTERGALLSRLEDPFEMFPIQSVAARLIDLVRESDERIAEHSGWWGVPRKYYSVEQEHHLEMISLLIGSGFVLAQAALTQAAAIAARIRTLTGRPPWLPATRADVLQTAATIHTRARISETVVIDAIANYFKHHYEWPSNWDLQQATKSQQKTIRIVLAVGLEPGNEESNLQIALGSLGLSSTDGMSVLATNIQAWRERLACHLKARLDAHGCA